MCAVFGAWNHEEASRLTYLGLFALQHRGQESAGIVSSEAQRHFSHKGLGLVGDVFNEGILAKLPGNFAIGHNRYSTTGENQISNAQPVLAELVTGPLAIAHNGNILNQENLKRELQMQGAIFQGTSDTEVFLHFLARALATEPGAPDLRSWMNSLKKTCDKMVGAYSLLLMTQDRIFAVRDPLGFRPLVIGQKWNARQEVSYIFASETCALDLIGAEFVREVEPGELVWVDAKGLQCEKNFLASKNWEGDTRKLSSSQSAKCIFEHVYFARPDSVVFNQSVYESRKRLGSWLARENPVDADLVVPVPDSGVPAALGYSAESKIPFEFGIIRNHYVGRTFIQPQQSIRSLGVKIKLNPQSALLKGKRVVVVDDSLVRGTTSQKIVGLIRQAGASEVHMRIASPPTTGPCYYGVDTPTQDHLIASKKSIRDIATFIGADSLGYLSLTGLRAALGDTADRREFCAACFDGHYPTPL